VFRRRGWLMCWLSAAVERVDHITVAAVVALVVY
jgi:hypothetical protein